MTPSPDPIQPHYAGSPSRVIQGSFPGGQPRIVQASPAPVAPVRPQVPAPVQARPGSPPAPLLPGRPVIGALQPLLRPGQPPRPILPTKVQPGDVQPATPLRPQPPQPILPQRAAPTAVQPHAGDAFALPANFTLKPRGSGQPLPEPVQKKMEAFFNTSFADVRVHVGHEAPSIGALAFTHGTDLYFAPGQYNPQSTQGQQLLGHELTHVLQQRAGRVRNPLGTGVAVVQDPALEAEAERMGLRAVAPTPAQAKLASRQSVLPALVPSRGVIEPPAPPITQRVAPPELRPITPSHQEPVQAARAVPGSTVVQCLTQAQLNFMLSEFQINFGANGFSVDQAEMFNLSQSSLQHSHTDVINAIRIWRKNGDLHPAIPASEQRIPKGMVLSFNAATAVYPSPPKGGKLKTRRAAAGYINPPHNHPYMRPLFKNAALSPRDPTRTEEDWLFSPSRRLNTYTPTHRQPPVVVRGHSNTVMGHHPDASSHWNVTGHKQPRWQNQQYNYQTTTYHGLEESRSSAASGHLAARYLSPNASLGSDPSYYLSTDPGFDPKVPWTKY